MSSSHERPEQLLVASGEAPLGYVSCLPGRSPVGPQLRWEGGGLAVLVALQAVRHHENTLRTRHPAWVPSSGGARTLELAGAPADGFSVSFAKSPPRGWEWLLGCPASETKELNGTLEAPLPSSPHSDSWAVTQGTSAVPRPEPASPVSPQSRSHLQHQGSGGLTRAGAEKQSTGQLPPPCLLPSWAGNRGSSHGALVGLLAASGVKGGAEAHTVQSCFPRTHLAQHPGARQTELLPGTEIISHLSTWH